MKKITLYPAYYFTCTSCEAQNYVAAEAKEFSPEETAAYAEQEDRDPGDFVAGKGWFAYPPEIACGNCQAEFSVSGVWAGGE